MIDARVALYLTLVAGCMPMQRDYHTARVFGPELDGLDTRVKLAITTADGADAEFRGALEGVTQSAVGSPAYASMMGRYYAVKKRLEADKVKWTELHAWATSIENDPTRPDVDRLDAEASTLQLDLGNIDATLRQLPAELSRVQMTSR